MANEAAATQDAPKKKKLPKLALLIVGISVLEAAGFFVALKMMGGGPKPSFGGDGGHGGENGHYVHGEEPSTTQPAGTVEVTLLKRFRVPNGKSGRTYIYDLDLAVIVPLRHKDAIEKLAKDRSGELSDAMARLIRAAEPRVLEEDDFKTLRLQMRHALNEIAGDEEMVQRVLIPRCVPSRAD